MKIADILETQENTNPLKPHIIPRVTETQERGISDSQLADRFGKDVAQDVARQKGNSVLFTKDLDGRNWKIIKNSDGTIRVERDYMLEGDVIMFEGNGKALVGTIVKLDDDTLVIEGGTFPLNEEEIAEGVGKWIGAAALAGLLGLGANQLLDPSAAERTPLGRAMADAAARGDTYAAKELKNLGMYMDLNADDQLAALKDTYLDVPAGQKYKVKSNSNESIANWDVGIYSIPRTEPFKLKKIVATSPRGKTFTFDDEQQASQHFTSKRWDQIKDPSSGWKVDLNNTKPELDEAEYHGRTVKLGKPMAGDVKKYKVYVKDPKTGNVKKVNFGDKGMEIKRDDPARRRNFRKRHGCGTPRASNRLKAAYWSCRMWSSKPVSKILKGK